MMVAMATPKRHVCLVAMLVVLAAVLSCHLNRVASVVMQADQAAALLNIKSAMRAHQHHVGPKAPRGANNTTGGPAEHKGGHATHLHHVDRHKMCPSLFPSSTSAPPCLPFPIRPSATALLNIKAAMGLTYTTWVATKPCTLNGATAAAGEWERVTCSADGLAYSMWMPWNFLDGSLSDYLKFFSTLTNLNQLAMQYMFFSGSFPSVLTTLPSLTSLSLRFNYLTGSLPSTITKIKSLDINQNYFVGSIPSGTWSYCDATNNCLTGAGNCQNYYQRSSCAICGSTAGTGTLCAAGQSCMPSADAKIAAGQNNYGGEVALSCVYTPITMNLADAAAMLNVKASLGVTYTTWAATTPCRFDQSTVALANEWTGVRCTDTGKVSDIVVNNANLKGSLPSDLASLTALTNIGAPGNYLIGTVPPLGPLLLVLDLNFNFISDLPSAAYTWCGGNLNCLVTPSKCTTGGTVQRVAADCAFCGTTNGAPPFCWGAGGVCTPDAAAAVAASTTNPNSQPTLPRACVGGPVVALKDTTGRPPTACFPPCWPIPCVRLIPPPSPACPAPAMLALKASLGVTLTTWAATVPCQLAGQTTTAAVWSGVLCDSTGRVVSMAVANSKLKGSLASDISTLTALTYLNLQGNLLSYRIDSFTTNLRALPVLADIGAVYNYFIGTVPALASGLLTLDVRGNFLTDVPTASYTWCGGAGNCLLTPSKCTSGGSAQRPAADCAFCGTTNGVRPFCAAGGVCTVDSGSAVNTGAVNLPTQPVLPMACVGGPLYMNAGDGEWVLFERSHRGPIGEYCLRGPIASALLNIKSAMGLTYTSWAATNPCTLEGAAGKAGEWERVTCTPFGRAYVLARARTYACVCEHVCRNLDSAGLVRKSFPSDISKLTGLGVVWMPWNFLDGSLADYLTYFSTLTNLNQLAMQYMFFSGTFPSVLTTLPLLTSLALRFNYLTGLLPTSITKIKSLDLYQNYFVGSIPSGTWSYCNAANNCLGSVGANCQNAFQRSSCAICGSTAGTGTLCAAGQSCMPSADAKIAAKQNNYGGEVALSCVYTPITMNPADGLCCLPSYSFVPNLEHARFLPLVCPTCAHHFCVPPHSCVPRHTPVCPVTLLAVHPHLSPPAAAAMLNVKASLGVTYTTWAATTPCRFDQSTVALANEWTGVRCTDTGKVSDIVVNNANLKGSLPSDLASLTALTNIGAPGNYLIGTVPPLGPLLLVLDLNFNFISDLPSAAYTWCGGNLNCLVTPSKCTTGGTVQRVAADCAFCGTTNGAPPFCWGAGGVCTPDAAAAVAAGTMNPNSQPALPRACVGGPVVALKDTTAMLALKASLGVTLTTWAATVPCQLAGQTTTAAVWSGVLCDSTGRVVSMAVANSKLKGSLASDISTLTALTYLNLQGNLLSYRLDSFTTNLRALPVLADIGAVYNYFTGTVPALASGLLTLDVRGNFLTDVPTASYTWCGGAGNCLLTPSKCTSGGSAQRPAADCAFCGTTNGVGPFCWAGAGGVCAVDAAAPIAAGTVNSPTQPVRPMACAGGSVVVIKESTAVCHLSLHPCTKAPVLYSLHPNRHPFSAPYLLLANPPLLSVPPRLAVCAPRLAVCAPRLAVCACRLVSHPRLAVCLTLALLHLTKQLFQAPLAGFTANLPPLTATLKELFLQYNWFYGSMPAALLNMQSLSVLGVGYNYLTGSFPASPTLKTLDVRGNFFYTMGSMTLSWCDGHTNCFTTPSVCGMGGTTQRPAADSTVLLALKSSLGVTLSNWNAAALCTLEGQTLLPAQWGGVRCTAAGKCGGDAFVPTPLPLSFLPCLSSLAPPPRCHAPTALTCHLRTSEEDSDRATGRCFESAQNTSHLRTSEEDIDMANGSWDALCIACQLSLSVGALCIACQLSLVSCDLGYNLFQGRLDFFAAPLKPLTSLKALFFHYNYFAGSIPSAIATLPQLTSLATLHSQQSPFLMPHPLFIHHFLIHSPSPSPHHLPPNFLRSPPFPPGSGLFSNYLTGTVPIPAKTLLALDVGFNFLSGTFPKLPLMFCAGDNNCFLNSTACRTYGIVQRPAGACAICGTAAGQGDLCFGGSCAPDAAAAVTASTVNSPNQPILPMACTGGVLLAFLLIAPLPVLPTALLPFLTPAHSPPLCLFFALLCYRQSRSANGHRF
ncbi:unnamed protein product, partial [Closterium sp. NIES-65]